MSGQPTLSTTTRSPGEKATVCVQKEMPGCASSLARPQYATTTHIRIALRPRDRDVPPRESDVFRNPGSWTVQHSTPRRPRRAEDPLYRPPSAPLDADVHSPANNPAMTGARRTSSGGRTRIRCRIARISPRAARTSSRKRPPSRRPREVIDPREDGTMHQGSPPPFSGPVTTSRPASRACWSPALPEALNPPLGASC